MTTTKTARNSSSKKIGVLIQYKAPIGITGLLTNIFFAYYYFKEKEPFVSMHPFFVWWVNTAAFLGFLLLLLAAHQFIKGFKRARAKRWEEAWGAIAAGSILSPVTWMIVFLLTVICAFSELFFSSKKG